MSYNLTKRLPSCSVERKLLLELESYVLRKIIELAPPLEGIPIALSQSFTITDKFGAENLKSVAEYQRSYFPDDTRTISIEANSIGKNHLRIEIQFSPTKSGSHLSVRFDGNSAREVATGIAAEILSTLESYKTSNHWFHHLLSLPLGLIMYTGLYTSLIFAGFRPSQTETIVHIIITMTLGGTMALLSITFSEKFRPYSTFETRRSERRKKQFNWIVLGVLGFILFTVVGVFLRQRLLGF